jgi:glycosyltransferase involved in cell wall biosynthesis
LGKLNPYKLKANASGQTVICMLVHSIYENDSRVKRTAASLVNFGYEVHVFALWPNINSYERVIDGVNVSQLSIKYSRGKKRFISMMWEANKAVRNSLLNPDVIHAHDLDMLLPAVYLSKKYRAKLIYDSHEWYTESVHLIGRHKEREIWSFIERNFISNCDKIITVNESIASLFKQRYGLHEEVISIRNFDQIPNVSSSISDRIITKIDSFKSSHKLIVVYGGYIQKGRGLSLLINNLKNHDNIGVIIAGDGEYKHELTSIIERLGLQNQVLFTGLLPLNELYYCYKKADLGYCYIEPLSKSYELALPNKLSQYVQCELAVLGSNLPEIAYLIEKYQVGLVAKNDADFENTLTRIVTDLSHFKKKSKEVSSEFSWEKESLKLQQTYKDLLN